MCHRALLQGYWRFAACGVGYVLSIFDFYELPVELTCHWTDFGFFGVGNSMGYWRKPIFKIMRRATLF